MNGLREFIGKRSASAMVAGALAAGCGPATVTDLDPAAPPASMESTRIVMPQPASAGAAASGPAPIVYDAVGVRITERGLGFVEKQVYDKDFYFFKDRIEKPDVKCFDKVGIDEFELTSHVDLADLDWQQTPNGLQVTAYLDYLDVNGRIFGEDSDLFDLCPSFAVTINSMRLSGIVFTAHLLPSTDDEYNIFVDFNQPPQMLVDDLYVDVNNFPGFLEDLVFSAEFVQDFLFRKINEALASKIPEMTKEALFYAMFTGNAGPFDYAIGATSIDVDANGANALFDIQVDFPGETAACLPAAAMPTFDTRGTSGLGSYGDASMAEVALADSGVNQVIWAAWKSGFMCFDSDLHPLKAFENVLEGIHPAAGDMLKYRIVVAEPPRILFEEGTLDAAIRGFFLEAMTLGADGSEKVLLRIRADMKVGMTLDVDRNTNRLLVSLDGTEMVFDELQSEVLFTEGRDTEEHLKEFIQGFVIPRLNNRIQQLPVTNTLFAAADHIVLLDAMRLREGHAVAGLSLYGKDDPEVDKIAPETEVVTSPGLVDRTYTTVEFRGSDNQSGALLYAWRLDGTGWSAWSEKTTAELSALTEGGHRFEVKSRDRWMNEDATPASVDFAVEARRESPPSGGFGCRLSDTGAPGSPTAGAAALLAAIGLGLSLRRRSRV